jgi:hypothetical protein
MKLLNSGNAKTRKGEKRGFITYGIHLAPSNLSGFNVCKDASKGCAAACLNTAGRGAMSSVQLARIAKTKLFFTDKACFLEMLWDEVDAAIRSATKKGMTPCFRLNLTSDLPWEKIKFRGSNIFDSFQGVQWYDYTKSEERACNFAAGLLPSNYHLTYSRSEVSNVMELTALLQSKVNVAIVFADKLPKTWQGFDVIDGDSDDLRFLDKRSVIVGLKAKGKGKVDSTGFVLQPKGLIHA